jgi:uncharacterized protein
MTYFPYFVVIIPTILVLAQMLCEGFYKVDPSFTYVDTSDLDAIVIQNGCKREVVHIPVPNDPYESILHAWLVTPEGYDGKSALPVIVMSHGIGGQKDMGLLKYGEAFASAGYAALIFDYRHFGGSFTKKPAPYRNFIYPWNHYADIITVVQFIQSGQLGNRIDTTKIVLWGTSFAGGHVLMAGATLPLKSITAIISQVPHMNGKAATKIAIQTRGWKNTLRVILIGLADLILSQFGYSPIYVKIAAGQQNEIGYMALTPDELQLYYSKHPPRYLGGWRNLAPARTLLMLSLYNPMQIIDQLHTPTLFVTASQDTLCPTQYVHDSIEKKMNYFSVFEQDCTHFTIYTGDFHDHAIKAMISFLRKHLSTQPNQYQ